MATVERIFSETSGEQFVPAIQAAQDFSRVSSPVDILPDNLGEWRQTDIGKGIAYINAAPGTEIPEILDICTSHPKKLLDKGKIINDKTPDNAFAVVKVGKYAVKIFNIAPDADKWDRERIVGLSAARVAILIEMGLAVANEYAPFVLSEDQDPDQNPIKLVAPHLYGCFHPKDPKASPYWITSYEKVEPDLEFVTHDLLFDLQPYLNMAFEDDYARLKETINFKNTRANWLVQKREDGSVEGLVKLGSSSIVPHERSKVVWEYEMKYAGESCKQDMERRLSTEAPDFCPTRKIEFPILGSANRRRQLLEVKE